MGSTADEWDNLIKQLRRSARLATVGVIVSAAILAASIFILVVE